MSNSKPITIQPQASVNEKTFKILYFEVDFYEKVIVELN